MSDPPADSLPSEWELQPVTEPVVPATPCWTYSQTTGILTDPTGAYAGTGYAGSGPGLDNPADQGIANVGPIPRGLYSIGTAFDHETCGKFTMRLTPLPGTDTCGRDGFMLHGDTASQDHSASHGCVIMARPIRLAVAASDCRLLSVTA